MNSPYNTDQTYTSSVFARSRFPQFFKLDIFIVCAILSIMVIILCFTMIFIYGLSCDTGNYTSPLITMIISNWLTHGFKYLFNGNGNGNNNIRQSTVTVN